MSSPSKPGTRNAKAKLPPSRAPMVSSVTSRGQTAIPAPLRARFGLKSGARLEWLDDGEMMVVIPVPEDPIMQFRGKSRATLTLNLLKDRKVQRSREG